jgi:hypothetical protein
MMSSRTELFRSKHFLLVIISLVATSSHLSLVSAGLLSDKVGLNCDTEEHPAWKCMAGGVFNAYDGALFSGTYMCRGRRRFFGLGKVTHNQTVCVPTFTNAVVGEDGDTCGCCEGDCPQVCSCGCSYDSDDVLLYRKRTLRRTEVECVSPGKASRYTAMWPDEYSCVPDDECPTLPPTKQPSEAPKVAPVNQEVTWEYETVTTYANGGE